jgi:hypothetical protein
MRFASWPWIEILNWKMCGSTAQELKKTQKKLASAPWIKNQKLALPQNPGPRRGTQNAHFKKIKCENGVLARKL